MNPLRHARALLGRNRDMSEKVVARFVGGALDVATGGTGLVGGATGQLLEPVVRRIADDLGEDGRRRQALLLAEAADTAGLDLDQLAELAGATEQTRLLAGVALDAAQRTAYDTKVRALGRALAAGVTTDDQTKIDEQRFIVAALADLEIPHVIVLKLLTRKSRPRPLGVRDESDDDRWAGTDDDLTFEAPQVRDLLPALVGALDRHGLVVRTSTSEAVRADSFLGGGPWRWSATSLGFTIIEQIEAASSSSG